MRTKLWAAITLATAEARRSEYVARQSPRSGGAQRVTMQSNVPLPDHFSWHDVNGTSFFTNVATTA